MQEKAKEPEIRFAGFTGAWEQRKLGELSDIIGGGTPSTGNSTYWDGNINWYSPAEISNQIFLSASQRKISELGYSSCSAKILPKGTVLFTSRAGIGKTAILAEEGCTNQGFQSIVPHTNELDSYFIFSRTSELKKYGEVVGAGSTFVEVSGKQMAAMTLMMPPSINEQKVIGSFFKRLDTLLTLHQRKYEKLLNIKKSMLEKMFPKEGEVVPEIRFKGFTGAWEQRKFGEMANRRSEVSASGNLPRVEYEDIVSGTGTLNKDVFEKQSQKQGIVFHSGDVLYGKLRPYLQNWLLASFNGLAVGDFWVLEPQGLNSNYLYRIIQTKQFDEIANQSVGTKMPRADWKLVSKATFLNPASFNEQRLIGKFFKDIDSLLTLHQRKLEMLKNVKQAFLEKMFV
jgi:type I restriction enzyme S subunit